MTWEIPAVCSSEEDGRRNVDHESSEITDGVMISQTQGTGFSHSLGGHEEELGSVDVGVFSRHSMKSGKMDSKTFENLKRKMEKRIVKIFLKMGVGKLP